MIASGRFVLLWMVGFVVIYCFCLFKQKIVVWADGSINTNVCGLKPAAGKEISKEEGDLPLMLSSTWCCGCMRDEVYSRYCFIIMLRVYLKLCGHRHTSVPGDINEQNDCGI
jgi:hypothetical protein